MVAPERDVGGALLQGVETDAANNRAFHEIDAKRKLPDAWVAFEGVWVNELRLFCSNPIVPLSFAINGDHVVVFRFFPLCAPGVSG